MDQRPDWLDQELYSIYDLHRHGQVSTISVATRSSDHDLDIISQDAQISHEAILGEPIESAIHDA